jgi:hypothetical protein
MQKVTFFHRKEWQIGVDPDGWQKGKKDWYSRKPTNTETWFDVQHGFFEWHVPQRGTEPTKQQTLYLPDGNVHYRSHNAVRVTQFTPKQWEEQSHSIQQGLADLARYYHGFNYGVPAKLVSMTSGRWKERPARVFSFSAPPSPENEEHGAPMIRSTSGTRGRVRLLRASPAVALQSSAV